MFKAALVALAALGSVSALPFLDTRSLHPGVRVIGLSVRSIEQPTIPDILVRGEHVIDVEKRDFINDNIPTKSDANGDVVPYDSKRDLESEIEERDFEDVEERDVDDLEERDFEDVEERDIDLDLEERDEDEVEFEKRQTIYPEELPTQADNGVITPFNKRSEFEELPYHKRVIPLHVAVRTNERGEVVPY